jgi:hypothetical protein
LIIILCIFFLSLFLHLFTYFFICLFIHYSHSLDTLSNRQTEYLDAISASSTRKCDIGKKSTFLDVLSTIRRNYVHHRAQWKNGVPTAKQTKKFFKSEKRINYMGWESYKSQIVRYARVSAEVWNKIVDCCEPGTDSF